MSWKSALLCTHTHTHTDVHANTPAIFIAVPICLKLVEVQILSHLEANLCSRFPKS